MKSGRLYFTLEGDVIKSGPRTLGTKIAQKTFLGILVLGSWFPGADFSKSGLVYFPLEADLSKSGPTLEPRLLKRLS